MIRPLRIRHRRIFTLLGVLLPVAFGLGIAARKPVPVVINLPAEFDAATRSRVASDGEPADIFTNAPVHMHTLRQSIPGSHPALAFSAEADFVKPDLLVYWLSGKTEAIEALPTNAVLLGAFNASELPLPVEATKMDGAILLYSLADSEIVAVSRPVRFKEPTK